MTTGPTDGLSNNVLEDFYFQVGSASVEGDTHLGASLPSAQSSDKVEHGRVTDALGRVFGVAKVERAQAGDVLKDWDKRIDQMKELVSRAAQAVPGDLTLDQVAFSLAFNVEGSVWFFAKAGAEASVEVTFKRKA